MPLANEVTEGTTSKREFVEAYVEGGKGNELLGRAGQAIMNAVQQHVQEQDAEKDAEKA